MSGPWRMLAYVEPTTSVPGHVIWGNEQNGKVVRANVGDVPFERGGPFPKVDTRTEDCKLRGISRRIKGGERR